MVLFWRHMKFDNSGSAHGEFWCSGIGRSESSSILQSPSLTVPSMAIPAQDLRFPDAWFGCCSCVDVAVLLQATIVFPLRVYGSSSQGWLTCGGFEVLVCLRGLTLHCSSVLGFKLSSVLVIHLKLLDSLNPSLFCRYPFIIDRAVHQFNPVSHQGFGSSRLVSIP